jgi:signal transduction histidine kinase
MRLSRLKLFVGGYATFSVGLVLLLLLNTSGTLQDVQDRSRYEHTITAKLVEDLTIARLEALQVQQRITDSAATGLENGAQDALKSVSRAQAALRRVAALEPRLADQTRQLTHDIEQVYIVGLDMVDAYGTSREVGNAIMKAPNGFDSQVDSTLNHLRTLTSEIETINQTSIAEQEAALKKSIRQISILGSLLCALSIFAGVFVYRQIFSALNARERALQSLHQVLDELLPSRESQSALENSDIEQLAQTIVAMVHEREENRLSLQLAKEAAESSDRAKTEFLANLSHEVRTPLNGILGMAEVLEMGTLDEDQTTALLHLKTSSNALLVLLLRLLNYAHIEAGKVAFDSQPFSVRELAQSLIRKNESRAQAKGLHISSSMAADVPDVAVGDEAHIGQVLMELLDNAVKFAAKGEVALEIALRSEPPSTSPRLCFTVLDSGPGIAEEHHEQMFQAFTQIDGSMTRSHGGVGLGLTLCRSLARAMGAELLFESAPGQGARFTLALPLLA